jgi:CHRD domain
MTRTLALAAMSIAIALAGSAAYGDVVHYVMTLNGASENPANDSLGTGSATIDYDDAAHTLALHMDFSGLSGTTTATHFHAVTATSGLGGDAAAAAVTNVGIATTTPSLTGFPLGVTAGSYTNVLDLTAASSWNPAFVTAQGSIANAEATFVGALADGKTYWNVHTTYKSGGEIRGFPVAVPEPTAAVLAALGCVGLLLARRHTRGRA